VGLSHFKSWFVPFPFGIVANRIVIKVLKSEVSYV